MVMQAVVARGVDVEPTMKRYLEARYAALMREAREIEELLEMEPKVRAVCPDCGKRWNKKAIDKR
jgi:hypothetical protein